MARSPLAFRPPTLLLYLNYGAVEDGKAEALAVAREIVAALEHNGLRTTWNGQWARRIGIALDWKRRREV